MSRAKFAAHEVCPIVEDQLEVDPSAIPDETNRGLADQLRDPLQELAAFR